MIYLLDTNVISEIIRKAPDKNVIKWISSIEHHRCAISVLTLGEIRKGAEKIDSSSRKQKIVQWLEIDLIEQFHGRIINIDSQVADKWGYLSSLRNLPAIDALIAASAIIHNLKLVTRNTKDFDNIGGLEVINPWLI